jgi:CRP-like cAMP-binding protein
VLDSHLRKLRKRVEINAEEEQAIRAAVSEVRELRADLTFIRRDQALNESTLLLDGWMARTRDLADGQRQMSELHVSGDFADLHSFTLKHLDHNVITLTACRVAVVPHERLRIMLERFPHLARVYWFMTNLDAAIHREWTVSLGRRSALGRTAHLFSELLVRLEVAGQSDGKECEFPLTQLEIAECLGLTAVHVNRTLQEMRRRGLIELENRRLTTLDLPGLHSVAEFDPSYLYLEYRGR